MIVSSHHYLVGPLIAFGALGVILLLCRWVFSPPKPGMRVPPGRGEDYGLLVPVTSVRTAADAEMLQAVLREAGIRCTVAVDGEGADLLVFRADAARARELVSS